MDDYKHAIGELSEGFPVFIGSCKLAPRAILGRLPPIERQGKGLELGGPHSTMDSTLASHPAAPGSILGVPKIFLEIINYSLGISSCCRD
jgi:hypothetical protein